MELYQLNINVFLSYWAIIFHSLFKKIGYKTQRIVFSETFLFSPNAYDFFSDSLSPQIFFT